jgi:hypothetical protein
VMTCVFSHMIAQLRAYSTQSMAIFQLLHA